MIWQRIRRRRKGLRAAVALLVASVILFYIAPWPAFIREAVIIAGIAAYAIFTLLLVFSRCPRCGRLFHNVLGFSNPLSRNCSHCGMSVDTNDNA